MTADGVFHTHGENAGGVKDEAGDIETGGEMGCPRVEHIGDEAIWGMRKDETFDVGLH